MPALMVAQDVTETEKEITEESIENETIDESVATESDNNNEIAEPDTSTNNEKETDVDDAEIAVEESTEIDNKAAAPPEDDIVGSDKSESSDVDESDTLSEEIEEKEIADTEETTIDEDTTEVEIVSEKSTDSNAIADTSSEPDIQENKAPDGLAIGNFAAFRRVDLSFYEATPIATYRTFSYVGLGFQAGAGFSFHAPKKSAAEAAPFIIMIDVKTAFHVPSNPYYTAMTDFAWTIGVGYVFQIGNAFDLTPSMHYGGIVHIITGNLLGTGEIVTQGVYNQLIGMELEISDLITIDTKIGVIDFFLAPGYHHFFDTGMTGHQITVRLGSRLIFK